MWALESINTAAGNPSPFLQFINIENWGSGISDNQYDSVQLSLNLFVDQEIGEMWLHGLVLPCLLRVLLGPCSTPDQLTQFRRAQRPEENRSTVHRININECKKKRDLLSRTLAPYDTLSAYVYIFCSVVGSAFHWFIYRVRAYPWTHIGPAWKQPVSENGRPCTWSQ